MARGKGSAERERSSVAYRERLGVPLVGWVLGGLAVLSVWVVTGHAGGVRLAAPVTVLATVAVAGGLLAYGRLLVAVDAAGPDAGLRAGRAVLPTWAIGAVTALDPGATRALAGRDADRRAHLAVRGYVRTAVRVDVADPGDPTPYWLVSTRHPQRLVAALDAARGARTA